MGNLCNCFIACLYADDDEYDEDYFEGVIPAKVLNHTYPFKNIVWEGAATNGTVNVGVYKVLQETKILNQCDKFAGTSSGSLFALCAACKIDHSVIEKEFMDLDFDSLKDDDWGVIKDISRFFNTYGIYKGDRIKSLLDRIMEENFMKNPTFRDIYNIHGNELYIFASNLSRQPESITFSYHNTPDMRVLEAVRMSVSIPFVFDSVKYRNDIVVDGGLGYNYPLDIFDYRGKANHLTLGVKILNEKDIHTSPVEYRINNILDMALAVVFYQQQKIEELRMTAIADYWERSMTVRGAGRSINDFNITNQEKIADICSGFNDAVSNLSYFVDKKKFYPSLEGQT
jgi:predicted acylesterase/phospholipase RssA